MLTDFFTPKAWHKHCIPADSDPKIQLGIPGEYAFKHGQSQFYKHHRYKWLVLLITIYLLLMMSSPAGIFINFYFNLGAPSSNRSLLLIIAPAPAVPLAFTLFMYTLFNIRPYTRVQFSLQEDNLVCSYDNHPTHWFAIKTRDISHIETASPNYMRIHYLNQQCKTNWMPVPSSFSQQLSNIIPTNNSPSLPILSKSTLLLFLLLSTAASLLLFAMGAIAWLSFRQIDTVNLNLGFAILLIAIWLYGNLILIVLISVSRWQHLTPHQDELRIYGFRGLLLKDGTLKAWPWEEIKSIKPILFGFQLKVQHISLIGDGEPDQTKTYAIRGFFRHDVEQLIQHLEAWKLKQKDAPQ